MLRSLVMVLLTAVPLTALAASPGPGGPGSPPGALRHDGGRISGRLAAVNFQRSTIRVDTGRGSVDFEVMPSTSIQGKGTGYHTITDLHAGEQVEVWSSVSGARNMAQIIKIR